MRILVVVPPERFDFYNYLGRVENVELILLWNEKASQMTLKPDELPVAFSKIHYWTEFRTPSHLLNKLNPDRIIFFEIIDLRQIALIVAASSKNVPTFYLEHGAAGDKETAISRWKEITFSDHKLPYLIKRFRNSFLDILRSKFFYFANFHGFHSLRSYITYLLLPFRMLKSAPNKVLANNIFRERVPQKSIVFNRANFDEYVVYTGIESKDAIFTGVPYFDAYYRPENIVKDYIVYIDHPYFEENLIGWTQEHHEKIARTLFDFAKRNNTFLYIKLHPRSNRELWEAYGYDSNHISIVQSGDFMKLYLESALILGFSSSLITGFLCAKKNVVILGWHPEPHIFGADFSKSKLCHVSFTPEDLVNKFPYWKKHNLAQENENTYQEFLKKFNYPFDGKATERVIQVITANEVS